eukprot:scaffold805_cov110-Isochrysis_galbana.AAC.9
MPSSPSCWRSGRRAHRATPVSRLAPPLGRRAAGLRCGSLSRWAPPRAIRILSRHSTARKSSRRARPCCDAQAASSATISRTRPTLRPKRKVATTAWSARGSTSRSSWTTSATARARCQRATRPPRTTTGRQPPRSTSCSSLCVRSDSTDLLPLRTTPPPGCSAAAMPARRSCCNCSARVGCFEMGAPIVNAWSGLGARRPNRRNARQLTWPHASTMSCSQCSTI